MLVNRYTRTEPSMEIAKNFDEETDLPKMCTKKENDQPFTVLKLNEASLITHFNQDSRRRF